MPKDEDTPRQAADKRSAHVDVLPDGTFVLEGDGMCELPWRSVNESNAELDLEEALRGHPEAARLRGQARALGEALGDALQLDPGVALYAFRKAIARLCTKAPDDRVQRTATHMVDTAVQALCGDVGAIAEVERFAASRRKPDTLLIEDVAREILDAAVLRRAGGHMAAGVPAFVLSKLAEKLGGEIRGRVSEPELAALLDSFVPEFKPERAYRNHTLSGIVAEILCRYEQIDRDDVVETERVRDRVRKVLERGSR